MPGHTFVLMQLWQRLWAHMLLMAVRLANGESSAAVKPEELREARWGKMRDWSCMWNAEWRKIYKTFKMTC